MLDERELRKHKIGAVAESPANSASPRTISLDQKVETGRAPDDRSRGREAEEGEGEVNEDRDSRFVWGADTLLSQCMLCRHAADGPAPVCAAFPGSIPAEILANEYDHRKPWIDPKTHEAGDKGVALTKSIVFEPREGINPVTLKVLYRHLDTLT